MQSSKEPWQQTRAEFHTGRNLHGSAVHPVLRGEESIGDKSGFFTTESEAHAAFYAHSEQRNETPDSGDIYAAEPPSNPLDLRVDRAGAERIVDHLAAEADRLNELYFDGDLERSPHRLMRDAERLKRALKREPLDGREIDSALREYAIDYNFFANGYDAGISAASLRQTVKDLGYDAFITLETDPSGVQRRVTVYVDRPYLVSHRAEVEAALLRGEDVPDAVMADYPDLVPSVQPAFRRADRTAVRR
jgi:hypothetical protein